jgi:transposase
MAVDYKRILQLKAEDVSQRGIADVLGCSRNTVASALAAAEAAGLTWDGAAERDGAEVRRLLLGAPRRQKGRAEPDFQQVHKELGRPHVTLVTVWNEYATRCRLEGSAPYQYSFFCEQYRRWAGAMGAVMRIAREPGERVEVDWAGDPVSYRDPATGQPLEGWLFVAVLPYSAYAYVEAFADMRLGAWIDAHVAAFEFFGGAARLVTPDNLRVGVSRADRYEPALNPAYQQLADHYGTAVVPARPRRPRDKPAAEGGVRHVAYAVAAALRDRRFFSLGEFNEAVFDEVAKINARPFQKRGDSRLIVFERDEKPLLRPLPPFRFEVAELRKAKPGPNYHVQVGGNFYSVPARLIGRVLDVRVTSRLVEVFDGPERVASHARIKAGKGRYATVVEHMPAAHRAQAAEWTPERFACWAARIGPATAEVAAAILGSSKVPEQSYRSCLGVVSLAKKKGGPARLEQACERALAATPSPSYTVVKRLWADWQPPRDTEPGAPSLGGKGFVRGAGYYADPKGGRP